MLQAFHVDDDAASIAWLANFEVEDSWKRDHVIGLPTFSSKTNYHLLMAEMALWLAAPQDIVLLAREPDPHFLDYLQSLGWQLPHIQVIPTENQHFSTLTPYFLHKHIAHFPVLQAWREQAQQPYLLSHGVSMYEQQLAAQWDLPLLAPTTERIAEVNSKSYSRKLCHQLAIPQVEGRLITSIDELERAYEEMHAFLPEQHLVLKESMGVSGKGLLQIKEEQHFKQMIRWLKQAVLKHKEAEIEFVLEKWINKQQDLNIQCIIDKDGEISDMVILSAIVQNGSHQGHVYPHGLPPALEKACEAQTKKIAKALYNEGYYGVIGIDSMIDENGTLYPCLEINARMNMSTYYTTIFHQWIRKDQHVQILPFALQKVGQLSFAEVKKRLQPKLFTPGKSGILICSFASVNPQLDVKQSNRGKLLTMLIGDSIEECDMLKQFCASVLTEGDDSRD